MTHKATTLDFKRAFPLKIFCIKDQRTPIKPTLQYQTPTIAFLSSLIQSERKQNKSQTQHQPKTERLNNNYRIQTHYLRNNKKQHNKQTHKYYNNDEKERLLSNIIGNEWTNYSNQKSIFQEEHNKQQLMYLEQIKTIRINNNKMLKSDFELFLKDHSQKHIQTPQQNQSYVIAVNNPSKTPIPTYDSPQINKQHRPINRFTPRSKSNKLTAPHNHSIVTRMNFRRIQNFEWSKLNEGEFKA